MDIGMFTSRDLKDNKERNELIRELRSMGSDEVTSATSFLLSSDIPYSNKMVFDVIKRLQLPKEFLLSIVDYALRNSDVSTAGQWVRVLMPALGSVKMLRYLQSKVESDAELVEVFLYQLAWSIDRENLRQRKAYKALLVEVGSSLNEGSESSKYYASFIGWLKSQWPKLVP